jgi:hypothetical protein
MGLREDLLSESGKADIVEVVIGERKFKLKRPTIGQRNRVYDRAGVKVGDASAAINISALQVAALIETLVDDDLKPVYTDHNFEELLAARAGSINDKLATKAAGLLTEAEAGKT